MQENNHNGVHVNEFKLNLKQKLMKPIQMHNSKYILTGNRIKIRIECHTPRKIKIKLNELHLKTGKSINMN